MKTKTKQKQVTKAKTSQTPEALVRLCEELKWEAIANNNQTINFKYTLGQKFNLVADNPETYGKDGWKTLQAELRIKSKKDVDTLRFFATTYTEPQIQAYNHRYDDAPWAKTTITWAHWDRLLARYLSVKEREEWMDATVKNGWNANELARQLSLAYEKGPKHGRKVKQPGSKVELLYKMEQPLTVFKNFYQKVWSDKDNPASVQLTHDFTDVNVDTVNQLQSLRDSLQVASDYIQTMLDDLTKMDLEKLWESGLREQAEKESSEEEEEASDLVDSVL